MKYSKLFGKTKKEAPHDANSPNAKLLAQAGFVDKLSAGLYTYLPLGLRVLQKINQIIREEMNAIGGQEILMPSLHPIEIWKKTGRDESMKDILFRTKSGEKDFILGPTNEEVVTPLVKKFVQSYKDLPLSVYQIQTKYRNEPRAKSGVLRGREFAMKDMYSFHSSEEDLEQFYKKAIEAYLNVYTRCGLDVHVIEASGGAFTDKYSHEFSVITPSGEDTIILCKSCGFAQNLEIAEGKYDNPSSDDKEKELEIIDMERGKSVADNAKAHDVPEWRILKSVVYSVQDEGLVGLLIRGDFKINEDKLENYFKKRVRPANKEELAAYDLVEGFISPVLADGKPNEKLPFIGDFSIKEMKNFVTGANKLNVDAVNANIGRDFNVKDFADFVEVNGEFKCPKCNKDLIEDKAIEAGNIFKLGTKFSEDFGLSFTGSDGKRKPAIMACYGIGNTRVLGTIVEASHDEKGIIWPLAVAPYHVHLVQLGDDDEVEAMAKLLYHNMQKEGVEVIYDDRDCSAGEKFNDADLIGLPVRIVISKRTLEKNNIEWKERNEDEPKFVPIEDAPKLAKDFVFRS